MKKNGHTLCPLPQFEMPLAKIISSQGPETFSLHDLVTLKFKFQVSIPPKSLLPAKN
jgi:hypothetical protein